MLVDGAGVDADAVLRMWSERYQPFVDSSGWDWGALRHSLCPDSSQRTACSHSTSNFSAADAALTEVELVHMQGRSAVLVAYFTQIDDRHIRQLYVGNYAEHLAYLVAGIENVVEFIRVCLA